MRKLILGVCCCLCFLTAVPVFAQDQDITESTKTLQAFFDAHTNNDDKALMLCLTKAYRAEYKESFDELKAISNELYEAWGVLFQKARFKIISINKLGQEIHADVLGHEPDPKLMMEAASYTVLKSGKYKDADEYMDALNAAFIKAIYAGEIPMKDNSYLIILVKENDLWKIDEEIE